MRSTPQNISPNKVLLNERTRTVFGGEKFRYGFNNIEKDDELKGSGNSYDFGARMYDNRLGRFLTLDKYTIKFPSETPYIFAGNSPIFCKDFNGYFKIVVTGEAKKTKGSEITTKRFEAILNDLEAYINQNPKVLEVIMDQTGATKDQVMFDIKSGQGPTIFIGLESEYGASCSEVDFKNGGLTIDFTYIDMLENDKSKDKMDIATLDLVFANTVLHEYTHYGDRRNNKGKQSGQSDGDLFNTDGTPKNGPNQKKSQYDHRGEDVDMIMVYKLGKGVSSIETDESGKRSGGWTIDPKDLVKLRENLYFGGPRTDLHPDEGNKRTVLPKDQIK